MNHTLIYIVRLRCSVTSVTYKNNKKKTVLKSIGLTYFLALLFNVT